MIVDGRLLPDGTTVPADVCVVGAGPAGMSLAMRLGRDGRLRVCVLESGGLEFEPETQDLARGEIEGTAYFKLHETRIRALGGSTMSWGGICRPIEPLAMGERPWIPNAVWPFPADALDPYLDDALELCGITPEARAAAEADVAGRAAEADLDAAEVEPVPLYFSRPVRFGTAHRRRIADPVNVTVYLHATATELETDDGGATISGVRVRSLGGPSFRVTARHYVLAGGGVENARLLLASNRANAAGIGNAHGNVGRFFMEHPRVVNQYRIRPGSTPLTRFVLGGPGGTQRFLRLAPAPEVQRREGLLAYHGNLTIGYAGQRTAAWRALRRLMLTARPPWNESPYYQDAGGGRMRMRSRDVAAVLRRPDRAALGLAGGLSARPGLVRYLELHSAVEQAPDPANRITLLAERDAAGVPRVCIRWRVGELEEHSYRAGLAMLLRQLERLEPGISSASLDAVDPWPGQVTGTWHHIGSTRMDGDPARGVVDADGTVHGVPNLSVTGSSVFPVSGSSSPTVTIVQLALRLADHLAARLP